MGSRLEENALEGEDQASEQVSDPILAKGDTPDFKWYVAHALTGQENKVSQALRERVINHNLVQYFAKILVPEESVISIVNGKKRNIKKKYFPGYILIKMVMNDQSWHLVKSTDKVTCFLGGDKEKPTPLDDTEATRMIGQVDEGFSRSHTSIYFSEGDSIRVIEGPFASFVGTVETVSDKKKLKVNVSIFGRPTPVMLDVSQVEKVR